MPLEPLLIAELALLGVGTGFLAGLLGIGGGMLMVPFLTMLLSARDFPLGIVVKVAIATSLTTILFTSLSSVRAHARRGAVRWDVAKTLAPGQTERFAVSFIVTQPGRQCHRLDVTADGGQAAAVRG